MHPSTYLQQVRNHTKYQGMSIGLGAAPTGAIGDPTTPHKLLRSVVQPANQARARALAQITSGRKSYHPGLELLCLYQWIKRRWPSTGTVPWIRAIPTAHTQFEAGPDTRKDPPHQATTLPDMRVPRLPQGPPPHGP